MSGLNARHLLLDVIRPTLQRIQLWSPSAEQLVLGTAAAESGLADLRQLGAGPALGLWQMEPATHKSLWQDLLGYRLELHRAVLALASRGAELVDGVPPAGELVGNLPYAAALCRVRYLWDPHPLPASGDIRGLAETWKRAYNSPLGAGTPEYFRHCWERLVSRAVGI